MEAASSELLQTWVSRWSDLVDFEIIPVETSAEFWATAGSGSENSKFKIQDSR
jgi:hypothetical protein